jgi:hypothetical protein
MYDSLTSQGSKNIDPLDTETPFKILYDKVILAILSVKSRKEDLPKSKLVGDSDVHDDIKLAA